MNDGNVLCCYCGVCASKQACFESARRVLLGRASNSALPECAPESFRVCFETIPEEKFLPTRNGGRTDNNQRNCKFPQEHQSVCLSVLFHVGKSTWQSRNSSCKDKTNSIVPTWTLRMHEEVIKLCTFIIIVARHPPFTRAAWTDPSLPLAASRLVPS